MTTPEIPGLVRCTRLVIVIVIIFMLVVILNENYMPYLIPHIKPQEDPKRRSRSPYGPTSCTLNNSPERSPHRLNKCIPVHLSPPLGQSNKL